MKPRLKLRQRLMPWMIVLLIGLQYRDPSRVFTILLVTFTGVFVIAWAWARSLSREIQLRRETRLSWMQVGGHIEERLTISNTSLFPAPYVELVDHSTLPDFHAGRISSISGGGIDQWTATAFCRQRGVFRLGDAHLLTGDPFGLFDVTVPAPLQTSILVLPQSSALPEMTVTPSGLLGEGPPRRNSPQKSMHASTVREFAEGDSVKLIHWPTTARMNKTFVRLMESSPEGNWWIVLDLDQEYMLGSGWDSIEEQSVSLATSLADLGLRSRKSVGLAGNTQEITWLPPQKGEAQQWQILQALAVARPSSLSLASLFDRMQNSLGSHHSVLIITACSDVSWAKSLPSLIKHGLLPTVLLMDTSTFEGGHSLESAVSILSAHNIHYHIISRGLIEPPKAEPAPVKKWTWRPTTTTSATPVKNS